MNKRQIIASLNNIANSLDNSGLYKEANALSLVMKKVAQQVPQTQQAQQQPQQSGQMQQQPNSQQMNIINESNRLGNELEHYREKFMSLFEETKRKIDSGIQMEEKNGVLNASIMMNQMIAYMQPLANKEKNINIQLGYTPRYNETTQRLLNSMRQYSNYINTYYSSKKRTQPAQQPVKPQ
jgi:hypothetical protein